MNAEPGEMRGSGQVIRVVNNPWALGGGHSAGPKAAVRLSVDTFTHMLSAHFSSITDNHPASLCFKSASDKYLCALFLSHHTISAKIYFILYKGFLFFFKLC